MVGNLVAQAAAGSEAIGTLGLIDKEGVPLAEFPSTHIGKILIHRLALSRKHSRCYHRESEDRFKAFGIEPLEEKVLQLEEPIIARAAHIRENKLTKHAVKVRLIIEGDIPKNRLIATGCRRLVNGIDYMLEVVLYHLGVCFQIILSIVLGGKVVKIEQKLHCSQSPCKLGANGKDQIDKLPTEALQVLRGTALPSELYQPVQEERIHTDRHAIRFQRSLIMHIDLVRLYLANVFPSEFFPEKLRYLAAYQFAVDLDIDILVDFRLHGSDVLACYIGISIYLRGGSGIFRMQILIYKLNFLLDLILCKSNHRDLIYKLLVISD